MEDSVRAYATENPRLNYAAIVARFGAPRVVAESYVEEMQTSELMKNLRVGRKVVCIVAAAALIVVMLWAGLVSITLVDYFVSTGGYMEQRIVEVYEIPYENGE